MSVLPDAERFRRLVDGSARGPFAAATRCGMSILSVPYGLAVAFRNAGYDRGLLPRHAVDVPVVCIGNLTLGGTGKTPLVAWVAKLLRRNRIEPAIVSRGYGAARGGVSDEAAELTLVLGGIDHVANRDRVAGAREAADRGADAVILDDGFQHRRLARTLDIVAFDATDPFGGGRLFPRGFLREPLESLSRAQAVVVTRAATVDAERRADIRRCLERACRGRTPAIWAEADHTAMRLRCWDGSERPLSDLAGKRLMACAAIGNPSAFRDTLAALGAEVVGFRVYPDHHRYGATDLDQLSADAATARADVVISTVKDLVKIRESSLTGLPLMALEIEMTITQGRDQLEQAILGAVGAQQAIPRTASAGG